MIGLSVPWPLVDLIMMSNVHADSHIIILTLCIDKSPRGEINFERKINSEGFPILTS